MSTWPSLVDAYDRHRNNFDALRFGLAAAVIWSHCYALAGREMDPIFAMTGQIDAGSLAVEAFFVLSGFLITQSWDSDSDLHRFAVKRALRLIPALVTALVFGAFVVGPFVTLAPVTDYLSAPSTWAHFDGVVLHRHLASPLLFADNPVPHQLNASLWSLRYETFCYGLIALGGTCLAARWAIVSPVVLAMSLLAVALLDAVGAPVLGIPATLARLLACFFAGSTLYALRRWVPMHPLLAAAAITALVAASLVGGLRLVFPVAGAYLLIVLGCSRGLRLQGFGRRGDFSYGLYVFAYPIQQAIVQIVGTKISMPMFFGLAFVPTLGMAVLSWQLIESPALARKPDKVRLWGTAAPHAAGRISPMSTS